MKPKYLHLIADLSYLIICLALLVVSVIRPLLSLPDSARPTPVKRVILPASSLTLLGPAKPSSAQEVIPFVKAIHIHGIPYEQAHQFGPDAVPLLLELLADSANAPYATNIVVTLGFIGHSSARQPLLHYLTQPAGEISTAEFRGLIAVPYALGQLAYHGDRVALNFLLQAADHDYWPRQSLPWTYQRQNQAPELYQQSLLALGISGAPAALRRLEEVAASGELSAQADQAVVQQALELNRRVQQVGIRLVVNPDPALKLPAELTNVLDTLADDPHPDAHLHTFTVAKHANETDLMSVGQVDAIFRAANQVIQTADGPVDIGCCVSLQRRGGLGTFTVTDGTLTTASELNAVFLEQSAQVKIVPSLDFCGAFNPTIVGCAPLNNPKNMILEYLNNTTLDGILWAHEFGHNQGLFHPPSDLPTRIMNAKLAANGISRHMILAECRAWHSTFANPGAIAGPCPLRFTATKLLAGAPVITSGARITYTLTLYNNTLEPVPNLTIQDTLPFSLTYLPGSATAQPAIINLTNFPTSTLPFTLNHNSSVTLNYAVQVGPVNSKDKLTNMAVITGPTLQQPLQASYTAIVDPFNLYLPPLFK